MRPEPTDWRHVAVSKASSQYPPQYRVVELGGHSVGRPYDVTRDGQRFVMIRIDEDGVVSNDIIVVDN